MRLLTLLALTLLPITAAVAEPVDPLSWYNDRKQDMVLQLVGVGNMYTAQMPNVQGDSMCFDVNVIDMRSNLNIGTATDCIGEVAEDENGVITTKGTTTFRLPGGEFVTQGMITISPAKVPTVTAFGMNVTHITGSAAEGNSVISGTGNYAGMQANARLSGMLWLGDFAGNPGDPVEFSCFFIISKEL